MHIWLSEHKHRFDLWSYWNHYFHQPAWLWVWIIFGRYYVDTTSIWYFDTYAACTLSPVDRKHRARLHGLFVQNECCLFAHVLSGDVSATRAFELEHVIWCGQCAVCINVHKLAEGSDRDHETSLLVNQVLWCDMCRWRTRQVLVFALCSFGSQYLTMSAWLLVWWVGPIL